MKVIYFKEVFDFLDSINERDRSRAEKIKELFENYGFQIGPKYIKKIRMNIWELRAGKIRLFLCMVGGLAYAVHAIYKKTQKIPKSDIKLAIKRSKSI